MGRSHPTEAKEPLIEHYQPRESLDMPAKPAQRPSPPSPTLSDMEHDFEIDIELGNHDASPSLAAVPSHEDSTVAPHPPMVYPHPPMVLPPGDREWPDALASAAPHPPMVYPHPPMVYPASGGEWPSAPAQAALGLVFSSIRKRHAGDFDDATGVQGSGMARAVGNTSKVLELDDPFRVRSNGLDITKEALVHPFSRISASPPKCKTKLASKVNNRRSSSTTTAGSVRQRQASEKHGAITRFLPPNKEEAFIGYMPSSAEATIKLAQLECPSLADVPSADLSLALHYDGSPSWVKDVLFRVMPDTWPAAVTGQLPLIHIKHTPSQKGSTLASVSALGQVSDEDLMGAFDHGDPSSSLWKSQGGQLAGGEQLGHGLVIPKAAEDQQGDSEPKTWDQLVKEGALLGIH